MKAGDRKEQDAGLWAYASVSHKPFAGKWEAIYALEYRSRENFRETSLWCGTVIADYVFNPHIKVGVGYEFFMNREPDGGYSPEHRYYPEAIFSYRTGSLSASFRTRVMNTFTQWNEPYWEARNRLKVGYRIGESSLKPFVAVEPYHALSSVAERFTKIRYYAGCSYAFGRQTLDIYYLREDYRTSPFGRNILAVDYNFAF
ncbi:hypothetical protein AGMMS49965_20720 [Bacteroidia bacterium]|nr:hypothetical protein AGMMS49965_20720 [Bacteroidia bacterium]